jgi:hypothetical protein
MIFFGKPVSTHRVKPEGKLFRIMLWQPVTNGKEMTARQLKLLTAHAYLSVGSGFDVGAENGAKG